MKTIGLLGGMSWESTIGYYRIINEGVKQRLGGFHSAKIALYSVDFEPIEELQRRGNWQAMGDMLAAAARGVEAAGADFLLICTNTMHKVEPQIAGALSIPVLHIADATAAALGRYGITTVGLLGTAFTMEQEFYKDRLSQRHGLTVLVPDPAERQRVHDIIFNELCLGTVKDTSRQIYLDIIDSLAARGAEAVILGCTEIGILVNQDHTEVRLFDTTRIHAEQAVAYALG
ncbi:aspartate/glutamate racemase family protein [Desulfofustis limnaeus]|jgi:aspartate racemase|uniref:Aspartate racemase n=1 Tax=Desulfofustis limnaeus TaxID=2740163 RepID=A0ABN6M8J5_9BACT|nr:aspartate/glutamate racemase family protein [Desulfofustis limnaeus]MDX9894225.1 aspartate/glutamate racemase family protein [Desulfofustis sp.]BDD88245.1 aspartate racemase [Desulfofustis limnaeus]